MTSEVPVQDLAKLNAHWYDSLFVALPLDQKSQAVEVHIFARKAQQLVYPKAAIERSQRQSVNTGLIASERLAVYETSDMLRAEGNQHLLFLFELRYMDQLFPILNMVPAEVRVDAAQVAIDSDVGRSFFL